MRRCSWWIVCGFAVLALGLLYCGFTYWYAGAYIPDDPVTKDSQNYLHSPSSDARIGALFSAAVVILLASAISLVGIVRGSRTRGCIAMALIGPIIAALPFVRQFAHSLMEWAHAL